MKKKLYTIIILTIILIIMSFNCAYAASIDSIKDSGEGALGQTLSLGLSNLQASDSLYCIQHSNHLNNPIIFKVLVHIKIKDGVAKVWDVNGVNGATSRECNENRILAEILSGNYGATGYGTYVKDGSGYTPTQLGVYKYWDTWINSVGYTVGTNSSWLDGGYDTNLGKKVVNDAIAAVNNGANPSVDIWLLNNEQAIFNAQRLMIAKPGPDTPDKPDEPKPQQPKYDGYIQIKGKVWVDGAAGKADEIDGKYADGSNDRGLEGITVKLKNANGQDFVGATTATTDANGNYTITVNLQYKDNGHVFGLRRDPKVVKEELNKSYVEFYYDGIKYTTVKTDEFGGVNTSKAKENSNIRTQIDNANSTITPNSNPALSAEITALTKGVINFEKYSQKTENETVPIKYCYGDGITRTYPPKNAPDRTYSETNPEGAWKEPKIYKGAAHLEHTETETYEDPAKPIYARNEVGDIIYANGEPVILRYGTSERDKWYDWCSGGHVVESKEITKLIIENVNLGLFEREKPVVALTSDISKVTVTMNNQSYIYEYGVKGDPAFNDDDCFGTVKFQNKYKYTYRRPVNPADIAYINDGNNPDNVLNVDVTYKVMVANQSNTLKVTIDKILNSFDKEYTIVDYKVEEKDKGKFKEAVLNNLNIEVDPQSTKEIYVTYKVSKNAIKGLIREEATLNNVFEIHTYITKYGSNTLCAEQKYASNIGKDNTPYAASSDKKSTLGNAGVHAIKIDNGQPRLDIINNEIDTDIAPSFVLVQDEYKVISGTVYEDTATKASTDANERLGNGIKEENEKGIKDVKVELVHSEQLGSENDTASIYGISNEQQPTSVKAVTYTDENGNYSFGEAGKNGLVEDDYVLRFTYGNDNIDGNGKVTTLDGTEINARNFKSTIVTQNPIKEVLQGKNEVEWHLYDLRGTGKVDNTTIAIDDMNVRKLTDDTSLINKNYNQKFNMVANSPRFDLQVEFSGEEDHEIKVNENGDPLGGKFEHRLDVFDFGIIERPREDLMVDKTVSKLRMTLENKNIIIDGDPRTENLDYTKAPGVKNSPENIPENLKDETAVKNYRKRNGNAKSIYIDMDPEYLQNATLEVWYTVRVSNLSEKDYEYSTNPKYYYYGDKSGLDLIDTSVEYVVDYLDPELTCNIEETTAEKPGVNLDWEIRSAQDLFNSGLITEATRNEIEKQHYLIFCTDKFRGDLPTGKYKETGLYASKLLANQDDDIIFENHTEIVQINGKVARTISEVKTNNEGKREQIAKNYIPGDYVPMNYMSTEYGLIHKQDDDMVKIIIAPPTGLEKDIIILIITVLISLTTIGAGVYIIKRKRDLK